MQSKKGGHEMFLAYADGSSGGVQVITIHADSHTIRRLVDLLKYGAESDIAFDGMGPLVDELEKAIEEIPGRIARQLNVSGDFG